MFLYPWLTTNRLLLVLVWFDKAKFQAFFQPLPLFRPFLWFRLRHESMMEGTASENICSRSTSTSSCGNVGII